MVLCLFAVLYAGSGAAAPGPLIRCPDWQHPTGVISTTAAVKPDAPPRAAQTATAKPAEPAPDQDCRRHTIQAGDTLGKIARKYLGNSARHREIAALNPEAAANPKNLRVGTELIVSCPKRPQRQAQAKPDEKPGFWSRLFGGGSKAETPSSETNAGSPAPEVVRPPPKVPVWKAGKGEYLIDVLEQWGQAADYQVIIEDRGDWRFKVPFEVEGPLKLALQEVVKGFGSGPSAPLLVVYANRVIRVGAAR